MNAPASADSSRPTQAPSLGARAATYRRVLALARPEIRTLALGTVFLVMGSGMALLYPQGMRIIVDGALGHVRPQLIDRAALAMAAIALIQGLSIGARFYLFSTAGERVVARLRERLYRSIMDQEVGFFDTRRTGELTSRLGSDTTVLQNSVTVNVSMTLRNAAQILGGIGFLLYTSPVLTALMLAVVPAVVVGAVFYGRRVRQLAKKVQDGIAVANEIAEETIAGVRTVRSFAAEPKEAQRYGGAIQRTFELARKRILAGAPSSARPPSPASPRPPWSSGTEGTWFRAGP